MLEALKETTRSLGQILRRFVRVMCTAYPTKELPTEVVARTQREAAKGKKPSKPAVTVNGGVKVVSFNMYTYKLHALGDYVTTIWRYGTSDNYSTQVVSSGVIQRVYSLTTLVGRA